MTSLRHSVSPAVCHKALFWAQQATFFYTEELSEIILRDINCHFYADGMQLLASTKLWDIDNLRQHLQRLIESIRDMCSTRHLKLNPDKTELIWFGSRINTARLQTFPTTLNIDNIDITTSDSVRDLRLTLDSQMNMRLHINKTVSVGFFHLRRLRQLRVILPQKIKQRLISTLIQSRVDYCSDIFAGLPATTLASLRRLMNAAIRFVPI